LANFLFTVCPDSFAPFSLAGTLYYKQVPRPKFRVEKELVSYYPFLASSTGFIEQLALGRKSLPSRKGLL
jgi:hypothetical protein